MASPVILCTDGSQLSIAALAAGLGLLAPGAPLVVVTVMDEPDPSLLVGTGFAGGVVTPEEFDLKTEAAGVAAQAALDKTVLALGVHAETKVLGGDPGVAICQHATESSAAAIVMGSHGRGGIKRALLGSVSDHVVRHAPCPVVVAGQVALGTE